MEILLIVLLIIALFYIILLRPAQTEWQKSASDEMKGERT
jgi:preprotein translocase subunit YajC